jgi:hypothetical protein
MSSLSDRPVPVNGKPPCCPTCHGQRVLPDPFPAHPGDTMPCPGCVKTDTLLDALRDVHDALQRALTQAEGPNYQLAHNRILHAVLTEWSEQAERWLAAKDQRGPDLTSISRGDWLE